MRYCPVDVVKPLFGETTIIKNYKGYTITYFGSISVVTNEVSQHYQLYDADTGNWLEGVNFNTLQEAINWIEI